MGTPVWHVVFQRLLEHLLHFQDGGGCSLYMHPDTRSVKCTFPGADPESDVVCVCGTCGSKRGVRQWVPLDREAVCKWPKLGLKCRATFKSCAARRKALKDKGKVRDVWGPSLKAEFLALRQLILYPLRRARTVLLHFKVLRV